VIGNSSSGIIETPIFKKPVVNIGERQKGRLRAGNVIDCDYDGKSITDAINKALYDKDFKTNLNKVSNIFGDGNTSERVVNILKNIELNKNLLRKRLTY